MWRRTGRDATGEPIVSSVGEELAARWDDTQRTVQQPNGNSLAIDGTMYIDADVPVGSAVWVGKLSDLADGQTPTKNVMRVVMANKIPDIRGREPVRKYSLVRQKDVRGGLS